MYIFVSFNRFTKYIVYYRIAFYISILCIFHIHLRKVIPYINAKATFILYFLMQSKYSQHCTI